jgi:hypothetical protein
LLIGGTSGKSLMSPSGRNIIMEVADDVHEILKREMRLTTPSQVPVEFSEKQLAQIAQIVIAAIPHSPSQPQTQTQGLICAPSSATHWGNIMPLMFLGPTFRFPVSICVEDAYRRWFSPKPPLPPLYLITSKMIPSCESKQHRKAQKSLRSKFAGVMLNARASRPHPASNVQAQHYAHLAIVLGKSCESVLHRRALHMDSVNCTRQILFRQGQTSDCNYTACIT